MTVEMFFGGFIILMMVAVVVATMTSTKSGNTGSGGFDAYDGNEKRTNKR